MKKSGLKSSQGFSLIELMIGMAITLVLLGIVSSVVSQAMSVNQRETRKADALVSAQAALNVISREVGNSGFGLFTDPTTQTPANGIVIADSGKNRIRVRSNFENEGDYTAPSSDTVYNTNGPGEDVTYYFDSATKSIVRYDAHPPTGISSTSVVVNKISSITFKYVNYTSSSSTVTETDTPTSATGRVRITVSVDLDPVVGQPDNQKVTFMSDVTLRNSNYMLRQY